MMKDFDKWSRQKQAIDARNTNSLPKFSEREVWWCNVGLNIGSEIYGKGDYFTRPVLILRKINAQNFIGIPTSTNMQKNIIFYPISLDGQETDICFNQIRTFSTKRLSSKIEKINAQKFQDIKQKFAEYLGI